MQKDMTIFYSLVVQVNFYAGVAWTPTIWQHKNSTVVSLYLSLYDMYYSPSTKFMKKHHKLETQVDNADLELIA